jgi:hypothetical protein
VQPVVIPLEVSGQSAAIQALERVQRALQGVGETGEASGSSLVDAATRVGAAYTAVTHAVGDLVDRVRGAVEWIAAQSDAAQRLAAVEANLGVSLERASAATSGYASSLELATTAQTLAERGIRVTQRELEALGRIAGSYSRTTGKALEEVLENLAETVTEGGEELGKFDVALLRVADTAQFTAEDRLRALVERADQLPPALETAEDRLRALANAGDELARSFASAFTDALLPFASGTDDARERLESLREVIAGVGGALGELTGLVAAGVEGIGRVVGIALGGLSGFASAAWAAVNAVVGGRDPAAAIRRALDEAGRAVQAQWEGLLRFGDRVTAARGERTAIAAPSTPRLADLRRDRAARRQRSGGGGGGGGGGSREPRVDIAFSLEEAQRGVFWREEEAEARLREAEARFAREARAREDARVEELLTRAREQEEREKTRAREQEEREKTLEREADFNARFRDLHQERVQIAESAAQSVDAALRSVGDALTRHWERVIAGQETVSEALRGVLADTLAALAREAYAKSAFYAAEGLARLLIGDLAGAGTAFAASAAYLAAGTGAQALGGAVGGAERPSGAGGAAAGSDRPAGALEAPSEGGGLVVVHQYYAPVIGGRTAGPEEVGRAVWRYSAQEAQRRVSP